MHINIRIPFGKSALGAHMAGGVNRALFNNGYYAVKVFFVISGFLITTNILRRWGSLSLVRWMLMHSTNFASLG